MTLQHDWSARHARLRRRLLVLAFLVFALSRTSIPALDLSVFDTLSGAAITKAELVLLLFAMATYTFVEFSVRTNAEARDISSYSSRLRRTLHRIEEIRNRTALLFRSFEGALLSKRLDKWNDTLKTVRTTPSPADIKLLDALRMRIERLQASTDRFRNAMDHPRGNPENSALGPEFTRETQYWKSEVREIVGFLDKMAEIGRTFEERHHQLDRAIAEARDVMTDARSFFSDQEGKGAEDLNAKLAVAVANIKDIQRSMRYGDRSFRLDRYGFCVQFPKLASVLLVLLSADVIVKGAIAFAERSLTAVSMIAAS